ncbi:hypothetical protein [Neisseria bacilliformis]|jgi:hypothetical protein|nr:hypothetical protein [Neisseria bacilliformis]
MFRLAQQVVKQGFDGGFGVVAADGEVEVVALVGEWGADVAV